MSIWYPAFSVLSSYDIRFTLINTDYVDFKQPY